MKTRNRRKTRNERKTRQLRLESLEDRRLLASTDVTAVGAGGWFADDMRNASGNDLVGVAAHARCQAWIDPNCSG